MGIDMGKHILLTWGDTTSVPIRRSHYRWQFPRRASVWRPVTRRDRRIPPTPPSILHDRYGSRSRRKKATIDMAKIRINRAGGDL